jgi:hypothetical protein
VRTLSKFSQKFSHQTEVLTELFVFFRIVQSKVQSIDGTKDGTFAIARVEVASTWTDFYFQYGK